MHNAQNAKLVLCRRYVTVTTVLWKLGLYVSLAEWRTELQVFVISTVLESHLEHLENLGVGGVFSNSFNVFFQEAPI
jgi:hypothetical protein